jgi:hypothetical protein
MRFTKAARAAVTIAAVAATAGLGSVTAASAAPASNFYCNGKPYCVVSVFVRASAFNYSAQVDNTHTGSGGVTSWIWVSTNGVGDHVDYYLNGDGNLHTLYTGAHQSTAISLTRDVTKFRVCGPDDIGGDVCSQWGIPTF